MVWFCFCLSWLGLLFDRSFRIKLLRLLRGLLLANIRSSIGLHVFGKKRTFNSICLSFLSWFVVHVALKVEILNFYQFWHFLGDTSPGTFQDIVESKTTYSKFQAVGIYIMGQRLRRRPASTKFFPRSNFVKDAFQEDE